MALKMAEQSNQNNNRYWNAQQQQQNGTHNDPPSVQQLNRDMIALTSAYRGGKTGAERANQERHKQPV
jgi:hypothetical protein